MEFDYTEEQLLVRKTAREFAEKHLAAGAIERDEKMVFPGEQVKMLGEMGFMGIMVPERWGGSGMDSVAYSIAVEEISRIDASTGVIMSVNNSLVCQLLDDWATDEQKSRYLEKLASGIQLGAFALSEPQAGSDASNLLTLAERDGNEYILNGTKNWVTNGIDCDVAIILAVTEKGRGHKGISAFIVEKSFDGFKMGKKEDKLGIRASSTCELYFDQCRVPARNRIGEEGEGFRIAMRALDSGRIGIASQAVGISQASLEESIRYSKERKQFGQAIAAFGAIRQKIARMATETEAARLLTHRAAVLKDQGKPFTTAAAMAKWHASKTAMESSTECVQIFGGYGYMQEYGIERLMRDAKITQIYEGTSEIQELVIARSLIEE
ncbi:MAG: acyl-CoA dehydrogenase [Candidatus Neomarinimicrobiota bacterium]